MKEEITPVRSNNTRTALKNMFRMDMNYLYARRKILEEYIALYPDDKYMIGHANSYIGLLEWFGDKQFDVFREIADDEDFDILNQDSAEIGNLVKLLIREEEQSMERTYPKTDKNIQQTLDIIGRVFDVSRGALGGEKDDYSADVTFYETDDGELNCTIDIFNVKDNNNVVMFTLVEDADGNVVPVQE